VDLKWFTFDGGTLAFSFILYFGDILTEVFMATKSRASSGSGFYGVITVGDIQLLWVFCLRLRLEQSGRYEAIFRIDAENSLRQF